MVPKINFVFSHKWPHDDSTEHETCGSATVDTPVFMVQTELELAGYENLKFKGYEWEKWAWPGGYPMFYWCADGGVLCPKCCNDNIERTSDKNADPDWKIVAADINYEMSDLTCDHCHQLIECAYDSPDDSMDGDHESALASAGWGTDEDYGGANDN